MKRIFLLSVTVLLTVCLTACALPEEPSEKIDTGTSVVKNSAYTREKIGTEACMETDAVAPPPDGGFTADRLSVTERGGVYYLNFANGNSSATTAEGFQVGEVLYDSVDAFYNAARGLDPAHDNIVKSAFARTEDGILTVNTGRDCTVPHCLTALSALSALTGRGQSTVTLLPLRKEKPLK